MIVVHSGGTDGFIPGGLFTFKGGSSTGDYHDEMNSEMFTKWLREQLIRNLSEKSVLVLDNASYHNIQIDRLLQYTSRRMTKPTKLPVCPTKTQVSLGIHPVWSFALCTVW